MKGGMEGENRSKRGRQRGVGKKQSERRGMYINKGRRLMLGRRKELTRAGQDQIFAYGLSHYCTCGRRTGWSVARSNPSHCYYPVLISTYYRAMTVTTVAADLAPSRSVFWFLKIAHLSKSADLAHVHAGNWRET